jgi:hypothetical protein
MDPQLKATGHWWLYRRLAIGSLQRFRRGFLILKRFIDFYSPMNDICSVPVWRAGSRDPFNDSFMSNNSEHRAARPASETEQQRFERILLRPDFKPLKAVFDSLRIAVSTMHAAIITTNSYQMFLGKVGYRINLVKQLHEQDCYARLSPAGGVRAVLPVHDQATYSTLVTLVNLDSTVTTTENAVDYYDEQLAGFKVQLMNRSGDAP